MDIRYFAYFSEIHTSMHSLLTEIFSTRNFTNSNGEIVKIHSDTAGDQCEFLQRIIADNNFSKGIEIGFAYGISTLAITEALVRNTGRHTVIDKFQLTDWKGNGLDLLQQSGLSEKLDFHEEFCYRMLPRLLDQGRTFDFAYIDSTKQFDWLLVDFFFLDKLLDINGVIVFDDVSFKGIRKLLRYISQFPNYEVYGNHPANARLNWRESLVSWMRFLPMSDKFIKAEIVNNNYRLGVNSHCVALRKIKHDDRHWNWHIPF